MICIIFISRQLHWKAILLAAFLVVTACGQGDYHVDADSPEYFCHGKCDDQYGNFSGQFLPLQPSGELFAARLLPDGESIIDGDTIRLADPDVRVRLLRIDTEEALYGEDLAQAREDWDTYLSMQRDNPDSDKWGTPMGNAATEFARTFFSSADEVYIEYIAPNRMFDYTGRHLAYIWVKHPDHEHGYINYNIEAVRAGMTPYFTKYGYSHSYHNEFLAAQNHAIDAQRGIWNPRALSYDDYDTRIRQWEGDAEQIDRFERNFGSDERYLNLDIDDAFEQLGQRVGQRITLFGSLARLRPDISLNSIMLLSRRGQNVVIWAPEDVFNIIEYASNDHHVDLAKESYIYVEGIVLDHEGAPYLQLDNESQIRSGTSPAL